MLCTVYMQSLARPSRCKLFKILCLPWPFEECRTQCPLLPVISHDAPAKQRRQCFTLLLKDLNEVELKTELSKEGTNLSSKKKLL